ncbi:MAG TPA: 2'-5' RNA ligase family protein [Candidatus Limnocylindrales bacterium]
MADDDSPPAGACIVAIPSASDPVNELSEEETAHVTLLWLGEAAALDGELVVGVREHIQRVVLDRGEFEAKVSGVAVLGDDKAGVLLVESIELVELRNDLFASEHMRTVYLQADQFPTWVPHLTLSYSGGLPKGDLPGVIRFDSVGLWLGGQHEPYALRRSATPIDDPNWRTGYDLGDELAGSIIPPVLTADDLPLCVQFAQENPAARWYAEKRALALGLQQMLPTQWAVPV